MCGFAGFYSSRPSLDARADCRPMLDAIAHRGPDDEGVWVDADAGVCLGHRRLAIQDLTESGHQPMVSHSGRFVVVFNGEIYNTSEVRAGLEARAPVVWRGRSDTETLLEAIETLGLEEALRSFRGMFAFALWDRRDRVLHLARDRFGEKPLYWGWHGSTLLFASELKAIRAHPACESRVDVVAVASYLERGYVPAPLSIYAGISKLEPGTCLSFRLGAATREPERCAYWSLMDVVDASKRSELIGEGTCLDALERALTQAVSRQMLSDVPLGAFLSGGIDSSLIVAIMQSLSAKPVKTFTIGFHDMGFDESGYAADVARRLGTDHTVHYVTPKDALDVVPSLPRVYDEPFADDSQIPTVLICRLARTQVTVALSGDAGDELFGGYNRYFYGVGFWDRTRAVPRALRRAASRAAELVPYGVANSVLSAASRALPRRRRVPQLASKVYKAMRMLRADSLVELSSALLARWPADALPIRAPGALPQDWPSIACGAALAPIEQFMCIDALSYLPDDILVKVDRAAMATSLETRVPFLDPDVVSLAWRLPLSRKVNGRSGKVVLRNLLTRWIPESVFERPKSGFGLPVAAWLRGPLREWGADLIETPSAPLAELLDMPRVAELWRAHQAGRVDGCSQLWPVLMLAGWLDEWRAPRAHRPAQRLLA